MMVETLFSGLLLAALSGLTFLAYKHPDAYKKIATPLMCGVLLCIVGAWIYVLGRIDALSVLAPYTEHQDSLQPSSAFDAYDASNHFRFWHLIAATVLIFYLIFLTSLRDLTSENSNDEEKSLQGDSNG